MAKGNQLGFIYQYETLPVALQGLVDTQTDTDGDAERRSSWQRFAEAPASLRADAEARYGMLKAVAALIAEGKSLTVALVDVANIHGSSVSTVKRAWKAVREVPEADWLPSLVKDYKPRQKEDISQEILSYFFADYGRMEQPQAQAVWERTVRAAVKNGWGEVPSAKTLKRRWDALPADVRILWRDGEEALQNAHPHSGRDRSGMKPLDMISLDGREWDLFVRLPDQRIIRVCVVMVQDVATNMMLSYHVGETESADAYRRALCQSFVTYGIAKVAQFDNTRAAANKTITAGAKKRNRFKIKETDLPGILPRVGCEPIFTKPYNGRSKTVERCFAEVKERSEKDPRCAGAYTGRNPTEKPENYAETAIDLALFEQVLAEAVEHYNTRTDRKSKVAYKISHRQAFQAGLETTQVRQLAEFQRRYFFFTAIRRTVSPSGTVTIGKRPHENRFHHPELLRYAGQEIVVFYDPDNLKDPVWAETVDGRYIAERIVCLEARGFNSEEDAKAYAREKRNSIKATKAKAKAIGRMSQIEMKSAVAPLPISTPPSPSIIQPIFTRKPTPAQQDNSALLREVIELSRKGREIEKRLVGFDD
ncbi:Mu transposase C-terminal domain-containing protein [Rhizobiaceae bacterium BDR2-2]|uniref:Mu transposase C-terminal domain-containing protein n=1 Tax=Ectorhizobium quercum TaxID=2965071 RepID=A0AAE3ST30_9HYPH|nr:transposase domain-containing protein [Ectorhizobium quercum]MCX8995512.1 Mu transposase C-terminal domain-containing protein [Ectorhizobium quercum]